MLDVRPPNVKILTNVKPPTYVEKIGHIGLHVYVYVNINDKCKKLWEFLFTYFVGMVKDCYICGKTLCSWGGGGYIRR